MENIKFTPKFPKLWERFKIAFKNGHYPLEPDKLKVLKGWLADPTIISTYLMLGVTYRCQLRCNHCGIIENCRESGELNVDEIKSLVDQVERLF